MKNLIIALVSLLPTSFALASVPAAKLTTSFMNLAVEATVDTDGVLTIETAPSRSTLATVKLEARTRDLINGLALQLGSAKISHTHNDIVCMMIAPSASKILSVSKTNASTYELTGKLRLVLGDEGCWVTDHTFPADDYSLSAAHELRAILETLLYQYEPKL